MSGHLKALGSVLLLVLLMGAAWSLWQSRNAQKAVSIPQRGLEQLPEFQIQNLAGEAVSSKDYAGKVLIVNFWASWCGPCVEEIPSFVKIKEALGENLQILAISNDATREDIDIFLKSFPNFRGPGIQIAQDPPDKLEITKQFGVYRLPESFIFNKSGRMVRKVVGTINWASEDATGYLKGLLNEPLSAASNLAPSITPVGEGQEGGDSSKPGPVTY